MNTTIQTDERAGLVSASGFERIYNCPGSMAAEAAIPKPATETSNDVALFGDRVHAALESGELVDLAANEEQVAVKIRQMEHLAVDQWLTDLGCNEKAEDLVVIREQRSWVTDAGGNKLTSAKVDVAYIVENRKYRHCLLLDAKTGFLEVTKASANWQLRVGIVALDKEHGPFESARVAIAQYRLQEKFSRCDYERSNLDHAYNEIVFHISRAQQPDASRSAGKWCQYCRALSHCQTAAANALLPSVVAQTISLPKKADIELRVNELAPADLAYIQSRKTAATNLFEAVSNRLKSLPEDELKVLGYELAPTGMNPDTFDIASIYGVLVKEKLLDPNKPEDAALFRSWCKMVLGDMKESLVERIALRKELSKKDAERWLMDGIKPHITYKEKAKALKQIKP